MIVAGVLWEALEIVTREAALFAATGFLVLGASDLAVDLIWFGLAIGRSPRVVSCPLASLPPVQKDGHLAVFVPAWDEAAVIGPMLEATLRAWSGSAVAWRIYVGLYPNDAATRAAVEAVADPRITAVVGSAPGPTTKAACLNVLWDALLADEVRERRRAKAVVLHDAEDVVDPAEPAVFASLVERFALVQLPVVPLLDRRSRWIGGHYADEFAEAHGKELAVRTAIGASLPSAGVGCAFEREALGALADARGGRSFDADSLTEDYELGLRLHEMGGRGIFARVSSGGRLVATREFFPATIGSAVRQKGRWMTGIALSGWDRLGWSGGAAERWMRLRDRQALLAALLLLAGYGSLLLWFVLRLREGITGAANAPWPPALELLVRVNLGLLGWRLAVRAAFTAGRYGLGEGLRALPRAAVANLIAILSAAAALRRYRAIRRGAGLPRWGKTAHAFPTAEATQ